MNVAELKKILADHVLWLNCQGGARADLADANLADAYLADANLADANLADAYLARANLADARNLPDGIQKTDPPEPYQRREPSADRYAQHAADFRQRNPTVPVVPSLDRQIFNRIKSGAGHLNMSSWHSCETTHCRAGWAVHLAGPAGYALEDAHGSHAAGRMIYLASTGRAPNFFATNERALDDLRVRAASQPEIAGP